MARGTFVLNDKAMGIVNEIKVHDRIDGAEVIRRALMLYHFIKVLDHGCRIPSGSTVVISVGNKTTSFVLP